MATAGVPIVKITNILSAVADKISRPRLGFAHYCARYACARVLVQKSMQILFCY